MKPFDLTWVEELRCQADTDPSYFAIQDQLELLRPDCKQVIETLPYDQRHLLEHYWELTQQREVWLTHHAYLCGLQIGQRRK